MTGCPYRSTGRSILRLAELLAIGVTRLSRLLAIGALLPICPGGLLGLPVGVRLAVAARLLPVAARLLTIGVGRGRRLSIRIRHSAAGGCLAIGVLLPVGILPWP